MGHTCLKGYSIYRVLISLLEATEPAGSRPTPWSVMHGWCDVGTLAIIPAKQHCQCPLASTHFASHRGQEAGLASVASYIRRRYNFRHTARMYNSLIRPNRVRDIDAAYCYRCSVVSALETRVSRAKTGEPPVSRFGGQTRVGRRTVCS